MALSLDDLLAFINDAFRTAPFPADGYDIYAAQSADDYGLPRFTTDHLPGRKWYELVPAQMNDCDAAFSYLRPEGWRHYLPAALSMDIRGELRNLEPVFYLRPSKGERSAAFLEAAHAALDSTQTLAVVKYLEYKLATAEARHHRDYRSLYEQGGYPYNAKEMPFEDPELSTMLTYWRSRWEALRPEN